MGSVGFLLADWSIELIRYRYNKRKTKNHHKKKNEKAHQDSSVQTEVSTCIFCSENSSKLASQSAMISQYQDDKTQLLNILSSDHSDYNFDIVDHVKKMLKDTSEMKSEVQQLKEEKLKMAKCVGRQLTERDDAHSERVKSLEMLTQEKEKQLLHCTNMLRQQLTVAKKETMQLQRQLSQMQNKRSLCVEGSLDQEMDSLRMVLDMKKEEVDQLKAANNSLQLELDRFSGLEVQLQVQKQRSEEMDAVIKMKNEQLRQLLDEYENTEEQLEAEMSAHLACQQELERNQWSKENFLLENEKMWKEVANDHKTGLIMDVVQKEKAVAYSFNC